MDTFTFVLALLAVIWSGYQQIAIVNICKKCPYFLKNSETAQDVLQKKLSEPDYSKISPKEA